MAVEQFVVGLTSVFWSAIALAVIGVILLVPALFSRLWSGPKLGPIYAWTSENLRKKMFIITGIMFIGVGVMVLVSFGYATITVDSGYVNVHPPLTFGAGNINITSDEIASAYVGQIGAENLTLSKQQGQSTGNDRLGVFTLGDGQTAYVISNNPTALIIQLTNGQYVILGTTDIDALASSFSQNVHPLKP
ncbi:MAG: hypothetical protein LBH74_05035 [Nitrososphaerota archaeon]|nr:hypothetical protein [Nitrososphaerota archaeon]